MRYSRPGEDYADHEWKLFGRMIRLCNAMFYEVAPRIAPGDDAEAAREFRRLDRATADAYATFQRERGEQRFGELVKALEAVETFVGRYRPS